MTKISKNAFDTLSQSFEDCKDSLPVYQNHVQSGLSITVQIGEYILESGHDRLDNVHLKALDEIKRDVKICQSRLTCLNKKFALCDAAILRAIVFRAKKGYDRETWQGHALSCQNMFLEWWNEKVEFTKYFRACADKWTAMEQNIFDFLGK